MRVISGSARGRKLQAPPGRGTRPITDRAKEGIFNMIESLGGVAEAVVVDLYAGSGSFGIECLSRGAAHVVFVERDRRAIAALDANLATLGFADRATVLSEPVSAALPALPPADIAFCDPPYVDDPWSELLDAVDADLVVGHAERAVPLTPRWEELRRRNYGKAQIVIARRRSEPARGKHQSACEAD